MTFLYIQHANLRYFNGYMMPFLAGMAIAYFSPLVLNFSSTGFTAILFDNRYLFVGDSTFRSSIIQYLSESSSGAQKWHPAKNSRRFF